MSKLEIINKEKELLSRISSGDKEAFGELYDFHAPRLFRFLRLKTNSQTLAEDLSSESFLRIWEYLQKDDKEVEESFQALLYKIARNLVADFYKKKSSQEILLDYDNFREFFEDKPAKDEIASKEEAEYIHKALVNLKEEYQNVLIWHYIDGLSGVEIAEIMNKSEGAVRVLTHRALKSLKKELQEMA
ncbi:MAG: RNA polymerase sigma factor [Candidatus Heimdallarchaeota archaeon]